MNPLNKLVAYRPFLATHTEFGIVKATTPSNKYLVEFKDGKTRELALKEFTIVWDKKHPDFVNWS